MVQALRPATEARQPRGTVVVERAARELFYTPERPPCSIYAVLRGRVSIARLTREGKRLVTEVLEAGDVFGDLSLCGATSDNELAEAITDCRVLALDSRHARALMASDPDLALRILSAVARRLSAACERLEEIAYRPVEARVASAVLRIAGSDGQAALVSHQLLADIAGTYRETASRVLAELQGRETLRLGRCVIEIRDPRALAAVAGG